MFQGYPIRRPQIRWRVRLYDRTYRISMLADNDVSKIVYHRDH